VGRVIVLNNPPATGCPDPVDNKESDGSRNIPTVGIGL